MLKIATFEEQLPNAIKNAPSVHIYMQLFEAVICMFDHSNKAIVSSLESKFLDISSSITSLAEVASAAQFFGKIKSENEDVWAILTMIITNTYQTLDAGEILKIARGYFSVRRGMDEFWNNLFERENLLQVGQFLELSRYCIILGVPINNLQSRVCERVLNDSIDNDSIPELVKLMNIGTRLGWNSETLSSMKSVYNSLS